MAKSKPIDELTARIIMLVFGFILITIGFYFQKLNITISGQTFTNLIVGFLVIIAVLIQFLELGLKRYSDISKLKKFGTQQKVTFGITMFILLHTILTFTGMINFLSGFTGGFLIAIGLTIILEVYK